MTKTLPWVWSPEYEMDIGPHVFPTVKYRLAMDRLLEEGVLRAADLHRPEPAPRESLARVHTADYLDKVMAGHLTRADERTLELPFSPALRDAFLFCCGGTTLAGRRALEHGIAVHLGGGFHHAFADHGEGFCLLNDVAVAAEALRTGGHAGSRAGDAVERVAVVDLDVHHGNGTAGIFRDEPAVFTFSMHQERNYPFLKPKSDLDVALEDGVEDDTYLDLLREHLPEVLEGHRPDLVLYLAGADPFLEDQLGGLRLTMEGLRARDRMVFEGCLSAGIPVAVVLAGGYAIRQEDTIAIHCETVREARRAL